MIRFLFVVLALSIPLLGARHGRADEAVTVFAAASLREALDEIAEAWTAPVGISYGGSGLMARQVAQGAPADVIILANEVWMDWLEGKDIIVAASRKDILGNSLVLVGPTGAGVLDNLNADLILDRLAAGRLAIGNTLGVPAGIYGRQWMEATGLWPKLASHLAETENVRAALALVSRGEAPLGVVYATDALADPAVSVVHRINPETHAPIRYPLAVVQGRTGENVAAFVEFLMARPQAETFRKNGFVVIGGAP